MFETLQMKFEDASSDYARQFGIERDDDWFVLKLIEEVGELVQAWNRGTGRRRPDGRNEAEHHVALEDETADVLGHVLLLAHRHGFDLSAVIQRKWRFAPQAC